MSQTYDFEMALNEFEKETLLIEQETRWDFDCLTTLTPFPYISLYTSIRLLSLPLSGLSMSFLGKSALNIFKNSKTFQNNFRLRELASTMLEQVVGQMQLENLELKLENEILLNACYSLDSYTKNS